MPSGWAAVASSTLATPAGVRPTNTLRRSVAQSRHTSRFLSRRPSPLIVKQLPGVIKGENAGATQSRCTPCRQPFAKYVDCGEMRRMVCRDEHRV